MVFGKKLISQLVIREKLARMVSKLEAHQAWLESLTYQMMMMNHMEAFMKLAGPIALLKMYSSRIAYELSDDAVQIFGGRGTYISPHNIRDELTLCACSLVLCDSHHAHWHGRACRAFPTSHQVRLDSWRLRGDHGRPCHPYGIALHHARRAPVRREPAGAARMCFAAVAVTD